MTITPPAANAAAADPLVSVDALIEGLGSVGYIASRRIATALYMAVNLQKPILVEGSAGVGKTELALSTATLLVTLDLVRALYEVTVQPAAATAEFQKQLLHQLLRHIRAQERKEMTS